MTHTIRRTKQEDLPSILELIKEFHLESLDEYGIFCNENVLNKIMPGMVDTSMVLEVEGEIRGVIAGFLTNSIQDDAKVFQEVVWYTSKKYRRYGLKLLEKMEKFVKKIGCKHMIMVTLNKGMYKKMDTFYERKGFTYLGSNYIKQL